MKFTLFLSLVWFFALSFGTYSFASAETESDTMQLEGDFLAFRIGHFKREIQKGNLPIFYDRAISNLIDVVEVKLTQAGSPHIAKQVRDEYENSYRGFAERKLMTGHAAQGIKDFPPFLAWLASVESKAEDILGFQVCKMFHITDLATFAYAPTVVFDPCNTSYNINI